MKIGYLMQAGVPDVRAYPLSGPANHVKHVFDELRNLGHEMRLLAQFDNGIWKSDDLITFERVDALPLDKGLLRLTERVVRRIQHDLRLPYAALFESVRFAQACQRELGNFDLFYERMGWMGYGGALAADWQKIPLILEVNGDHLWEMETIGIAPTGAQRNLSIWLMRRAAHRAHYAAASGEGWRQRHIDRWQLPPEKVKVVENGSDMIARLSRESLRSFSTLALDATPTTNIIYVGGFERWHGLHVLLGATAKAVTAGAQLQVVLAGSGPEESNLRQLAVDLGVADRIRFCGHLGPDDLAQQLANADIGVSPYCGRVEYSGLKLLDYKAAGLATIASGKDGQPAILEHGRTGWIVPPCDEDALGDALRMLAANATLRQEIGRAARIEAEAQHSWRHTAEELAQLFQQLP